jgi:hypothetical protein
LEGLFETIWFTGHIFHARILNLRDSKRLPMVKWLVSSKFRAVELVSKFYIHSITEFFSR